MSSHKPPKLYTRDQFREGVFARDGHKCVNCGAAGVPLDAHHIIERRLFENGGYYLENGATLCDPQCHMLAESTLLSCDVIRTKCGIQRVVLPDHLYPDDEYDKWGNQILPNGNRLMGELFWDASVHAVLSPVLHLFSPHTKAPRTWHLPWSPGKTPDDRVLANVEYFVGKRVVVTAKQDGENVSIYGPDGYAHARKVEPINTPNSDRVKSLAAEIGQDIPSGWRVCGESLWRTHTIEYKNLRPHERWFYQVFNIWDETNMCLSWSQVEEWSSLLNLPTVPVLYQGVWDEKKVKSLFQGTFEGDPMEGYVVRLEEGFPFKDYRRAVGKYVREKFHTETPRFKWRYMTPTFNQPKDDHA